MESEKHLSLILKSHF